VKLEPADLKADLDYGTPQEWRFQCSDSSITNQSKWKKRAVHRNGTQLLAFDSNNGTASETIATSMKLDTEMSTPMLIADLIYCV